MFREVHQYILRILPPMSVIFIYTNCPNGVFPLLQCASRIRKSLSKQIIQHNSYDLILLEENHPLNRYPALCPENLGKSDQVTFLGKLLKDGRSPNHNRWTKSECWDVPDQGEGFGDGKVMKMWYTCLICLYESISLEIIEGNFEKSPTCCKSKVFPRNTTHHNSCQRCDDTKINGV